MNTERKLTLRQERFVLEYLASLNAAEAARKAGYSKKYAREIGFQNLEKLHIRARIQGELEKLKSDKIAGPDEVLQLLSAAARGELKEQVLHYKKGQRPELLISQAALSENAETFCDELRPKFKPAEGRTWL